MEVMGDGVGDESVWNSTAWSNVAAAVIAEIHAVAIV